MREGTSFQGANYVGNELSHSIKRGQVVVYDLSGGQLMQCQKSHVIYQVSTWKDSDSKKSNWNSPTPLTNTFLIFTLPTYFGQKNLTGISNISDMAKFLKAFLSFQILYFLWSNFLLLSNKIILQQNSSRCLFFAKKNSFLLRLFRPQEHLFAHIWKTLMT